MVATVRCEEIANEKFTHLTSNEVCINFPTLRDASISGMTENFTGEILNDHDVGLVGIRRSCTKWSSTRFW